MGYPRKEVYNNALHIGMITAFSLIVGCMWSDVAPPLTDSRYVLFVMIAGYFTASPFGCDTTDGVEMIDTHAPPKSEELFTRDGEPVQWMAGTMGMLGAGIFLVSCIVLQVRLLS